MIGNKLLLQFNVNKQEIERLDNNVLVGESQNFAYIKFEFSDEWINLNKTVIFNNVYLDYPIEVVMEDDTIQVPNEFISFPGFIFKVIGTNDDVTITTQFKMIDVNQS